VRAVQRLAVAVAANGKAERVLPRLHRVPERFIDNAQFWQLGPFPGFGRVRPRLPLARARVPHIADAVPDQPAGIELVYAIWPFAVAGIALWITLHSAGVHAALAGVILAAFLPNRPAPAAGPLLAQTATALAELEYVESEVRESEDQKRIEQEPVWEWASRNLSAASDRLLSPADRVEQAVAPWSVHFVLPLFAFSATGVALDVDLSSPTANSILWGVVLGLVFGKPLGVLLASTGAIKARLGLMPDGVSASIRRRCLPLRN